MKKLTLLLVLALVLSGCGGKALTCQVLDLWEDRVLVAPDTGGRLTLRLPEGGPEPQVGDWIRATCSGDRLTRFQVLEVSPTQPPELTPPVPQLNP